MNNVVAWFVRNPVAANLLMWAIIAAGALSVPGIKKEVFPEFRTNMLSVQVAYPGATPEDVQQSICARIEEEVLDVDGVSKLNSTAAEGMGNVTIELLKGTDPAKALDEVKARVDALDTLPEDTEEPVITEISMRRQTISIAISGDLDERSLRELGQRVRDEVSALDGITQVDLGAIRGYEISVEVSESSLRRHGLTFEEVVQAVRRSSIDLPGGSLKTAGGEILLRTKSQAYTGREFEELVLRTRPDGSRLLLGDVARIDDGFADTEESARFDGKPTALVDVFRIGKQDAIEISAAVREYIEEAQASMPEGVTLTPWRDEAILLSGRLELLVRSGVQGFLLVFLVLTLFLRFRLALWVSLGIPISFLGALAVMPLLGASINMLSLFAFILVLGIVVDDAIVVGENVFTHSRSGKSGERAAIEGTREVAVPVTFAILTTIAAFLPMAMIGGAIGQFWIVIPIIVISTLVFSMVESKLILPAHLRHLDSSPSDGIWSRLQQKIAGGLEQFAKRIYRPVLEHALRNRYLTMAIAVGVLTVSIALVSAGHVRFVFFPPVDGDNVVVDLTMPAGTPVEVTRTEIEKLEAVALRLREAFPGSIEHIMTIVGTQPYRKTQAEGTGLIVEGNAGSQFGEVNIQLAPSEVREVSSKEIEERWRALSGPVPGAVETKFSSSLLNVGADFEIQLRAEDRDQLRAAVARFEQKLATYEGVTEVSNSFRAGKTELEFEIRETAEALGLTSGDLARQVRQGFYGAEAQRIQRGRDDIKVMVRYPATERRSLDQLNRVRIRTPAGGEVPFATVASARFAEGTAAINRVDRKQSISVTAEIDKTVNDSNKIIENLQQGYMATLVADHPGLTYAFEGEQTQQRDTFSGLGTGSIFALLLIFGLMAIPFRSYLQPLIVMSVIPFGVVGAIFGHIIMGMELSVLSLCGVIALLGIVVNDSIVLVDFVNRKREGAAQLTQAVREAGVARFRPILLTSLTTFAGLFPLLLERSVQAKFLVPMAVSLAFGVLFATLITLFLIPVAYLILEDLRNGWNWLYGKEPAAIAASDSSVSINERR